MYQDSQEVHLIYSKAPLVEGVAPSFSLDLAPNLFDVSNLSSTLRASHVLISSKLALFDITLVAFDAGKAMVVSIPPYDSLVGEGGLHAIRGSMPKMTLWQPSCDDLEADEWKAPALEHLFCSVLTQATGRTCASTK